MGSDISDSIYYQKNFNTSVLENLNQNCQAKCDIDVSGNSIIVGPGSSVGNIEIGSNSSCQAAATCSMTQAATASLTNVLESMIDQNIKTITDLFGDFEHTDIDNDVVIKESLSNYITQMTSQTCQADSNVQINDNLIYVGSGSNASDLLIGSNNTVTSTASCAMSNISKMTSYNRSITNTQQTSSTKGLFAVMAIVLVIILVVGGIVVVILIATGAISFVFNGHKAKSEEGEEGGSGVSASDIGAELAQLESLASKMPEV